MVERHMEGTDKTEAPRNGACSGKPVDWFYPIAPRTRESIINNRAAINLCKECDILNNCLNYALEFELHGIWGATMPRELEEIRRARGIALRHRQYDALTGEVTIR